MMTPHSLERVKDGELAFHLQEYDEFTDDLLTRWQEIMVLHNGKPCRHFEAMGPSTAYTCGPVKILATIVTDHKVELAGDTAGDLRLHADRFRESGFMEEIMAEAQAKSTLFEDWLKFNEMKKTFVQANSRTVKTLKEYAHGA